MMKDVFSLPRAFVFNTDAEREMLGRYFPFEGKYGDVVGVGVDVPEPPDVAGFRRKFDVHGPFILYAGRIEPGKGCAELLDHFGKYARRAPEMKLLLVGNRLMDLPDDPSVRYLGFVSPEEKNAAMAAALATIHPSHFESLCMAALESLAVETPILVQAGTEPLRQHCLKGRAGLYYSDYPEFEACLDLLRRDGALRRAFGRNGRAYVLENYTWELVIGKYEKLFGFMLGDGQPFPRN